MNIRLTLLLLLLCFGCTRELPHHRGTASVSQAAFTTAVVRDSMEWRDSLEQVFDRTLGIPPGQKMSAEKSVDLDHPRGTPAPPYFQRGGCYEGVYDARVNANGALFAYFDATIELHGGVQSMNLLLEGLTLGWDWENGSTIMSGALAGTTYGTATYSYGIVNFNFSYALDWRVSPANCKFYYHWRKI